jgi:hypothetical protein
MVLWESRFFDGTVLEFETGCGILETKARITKIAKELVLCIL